MVDLVPIHVNWQQIDGYAIGEQKANVGNYRMTVTFRKNIKDKSTEEWLWHVDLIWPDNHLSQVEAISMDKPLGSRDEAKSAAIHALCQALMGPIEFTTRIGGRL